MKFLTFLFFADVVQISTWDKALQAVLRLDTPQTLRIRRDRFSASRRHRNLCFRGFLARYWAHYVVDYGRDVQDEGRLAEARSLRDDSSNKGLREEEALDCLARLKDITHGIMDIRSISGTLRFCQKEHLGTVDWKNGSVRVGRQREPGQRRFRKGGQQRKDTFVENVKLREFFAS
ncbi:hypothetical protein GE21DRAFT_5322 [Neurospora crassa]|uniref:Uncharacterized protein n=1 Tax=Neurospora crassa (strain ATCC 24698 / 74-OR23-1A / CBS 708.71 / DSM 1257 / FGSC 987) TaxID=367110 RepID=A7UWI8_NEUCR|nr:hypothetical protein NCU10502 [Neurospora crassa OR74A]EDO65175.1 hypothetical protein NCU10502 [Neurospora crassa OR74A]KHE81907.1 hypothetical protein GE21DRAFT_5322 [Neurospora crassa]|eukprot:XP_001728266.1 hypothetical protein NCU10502 [Neurospora crassa OR74A]